MQPICYNLSKMVSIGILIVFPAVMFASCSTIGRTAGQPGPVTASKSTDAVREKAAERRRWEDRVQRDNQLDPTGSSSGSYGSFGPRFTW